MPCDDLTRYVPTEAERVQQERDQALTRLETELQAGTAYLSTDVFGQTKIEGATELPVGMHDVCILAALQTRNSLAWQLASARAGVQTKDFVAAHNTSHGH